MDPPKLSQAINRIHILGGPASGKTHLASQLSEKLNIKHYDLDDVAYETKYSRKRAYAERKKLLEKICAEKSWIIEGSYAREWASAAFSKSDVIIFLDFPISTIIVRLIAREFSRQRSGLKDLLLLLKYALTYKKYLKEGSMFEKCQNKIIQVGSKMELDHLLASANI